MIALVKALNYFLFHGTRFIFQGWNINTVQQHCKKGFVMERFIEDTALGVYIMVSVVAHFFGLLFLVRKTPLWCLDSNLHNKETLPSQILPECKEEQVSIWRYLEFLTRSIHMPGSQGVGRGYSVVKWPGMWHFVASLLCCGIPTYRG